LSDAVAPVVTHRRQYFGTAPPAFDSDISAFGSFFVAISDSSWRESNARACVLAPPHVVRPSWPSFIAENADR